jgi:hypothetical protein
MEPGVPRRLDVHADEVVGEDGRCLAHDAVLFPALTEFDLGVLEDHAHVAASLEAIENFG